MNIHAPLAFAAALFCSVAPSFAQSVIVVDDQPGPGVNYTDLSAALLAANDGDVVLIKPGDYFGAMSPFGLPEFRIDGKSLDIVGDPGGEVRLRDAFFFVQNLAANQHVTVTGIEFADASFSTHTCQGPVAVRNCRFPSFGGFSSSPSPKRMVQATDTDTLIFENSFIEGRATSGSFGTSPGDAILAENSNLYIYDSTILGGKGNYGKVGARGIRLSNSSLFASGGMILGGQAGDYNTFSGTCGMPGIGLEILPGSSAEVVNVRIAGGAPGNFCPVPYDNSADAISDYGSGLTITQKVPHGISATSPVREGQMLTLGATGQMGEFVFLAITGITSPMPLPGLTGLAFFDPATSILTSVGTIKSTAKENFTFPIAPMPVGVDTMALTTQLLFVDTIGAAYASGMARVVVLDSKF